MRPKEPITLHEGTVNDFDERFAPENVWYRRGALIGCVICWGVSLYFGWPLLISFIEWVAK